MIKLYTSMAFSSISRSRWRSLLTMLGVIIGVTSVIMIFALGEGIKRQVAGELKDLGADLVVVRSGNIVERDEGGKITQINLSDVLSQSTLTDLEVEALKTLPSISAVAPSAYISAPVTVAETGALIGDATIIATTPQIRDVLNKEVETGEFFTTPEMQKNIAVIGPALARRMFADDPPVGRIIKLKNVDYIVRGVMEESKPSPLDLITADYNNAIYIPLASARTLNGGSLGIREIGIRLNGTNDLKAVVSSINQKVLESRQGVRDFSVLEARDFIVVLDQVFGVLTAFVAAVAAISLVVGGIGIMNIMLVSVTERTKEIGIRKSIGATNQQILGQFLVEAIILALIGGLIGILISLIMTGVMRLYTDLQPFVQWQVVLISLAVTLAVGVIFGIVPALKASRKDPIESLR